MKINLNCNVDSFPVSRPAYTSDFFIMVFRNSLQLIRIRWLRSKRIQWKRLLFKTRIKLGAEQQENDCTIAICTRLRLPYFVVQILLDQLDEQSQRNLIASCDNAPLAIHHHRPAPLYPTMKYAYLQIQAHISKFYVDEFKVLTHIALACDVFRGTRNTSKSFYLGSYCLAHEGVQFPLVFRIMLNAVLLLAFHWWYNRYGECLSEISFELQSTIKRISNSQKKLKCPNCIYGNCTKVQRQLWAMANSSR
jgi:hypothetical protein